MVAYFEKLLQSIEVVGQLLFFPSDMIVQLGCFLFSGLQLLFSLLMPPLGHQDELILLLRLLIYLMLLLIFESSEEL